LQFPDLGSLSSKLRFNILTLRLLFWEKAPHQYGLFFKGRTVPFYCHPNLLHARLSRLQLPAELSKSYEQLRNGVG
jgi:hypothetical protein